MISSNCSFTKVVQEWKDNILANNITDFEKLRDSVKDIIKQSTPKVNGTLNDLKLVLLWKFIALVGDQYFHIHTLIADTKSYVQATLLETNEIEKFAPIL